MGSPIVTMQTTVQCSHGATGNLSLPDSTVKVNGQPVLTLQSVGTVASCPFQVPVGTGSKPQPCIQLNWKTAQPAQKVRVNGQPVLLQTTLSSSQCLSAEQIPQGAPIVSQIQAGVTGV